MIQTSVDQYQSIVNISHKSFYVYLNKSMKAFLAQGPIYIILSKFQAIYATRAEHSSAVLIKVKSRNNIDSTKIEWDETPQILQA